LGKPDPNLVYWLKDKNTRPGLQASHLRQHPKIDWIKPALDAFYRQGLVTDILREVKSGKEATVFLCQPHPSLGADSLALKVYSPAMFRRMRGDRVYRLGRQSTLPRRTVSRDRSALLAETKNPRGRNAQFAQWVDYEYTTHLELYQAGARVPRPYAHHGNAILMEFLGDNNGVAPMLHNIDLSPRLAQTLFDRLINDVRLFLLRHRIHGDLSPYNILYWRQRAWIIDFGRAVDARNGDEALPLLERDIDRICAYFAAFGVCSRPQRLTQSLWRRYQYNQLAD
jgi:RIO kinase 1